MTQETLKKQAAVAAVSALSTSSSLDERFVLGVGSGSTIRYFIEALGPLKLRIDVAIASSKETEKLLKAMHIPVVDLNSVSDVDVYVDGTDEITPDFNLIKGGGGALTREKILATASRRFICIADASKKVARLGAAFPLPVEVIPMARGLVAREIVKLGGSPMYRQGVVTDNGNIILDIHDLEITSPMALEETLNNIPGVVTNGLFTKQIPHEVFIALAIGETEHLVR